MTGTLAGLFIVMACALLEAAGQTSLKKSMRRQRRWFVWLVLGVVTMAAEALVYDNALSFLPLTVAFTMMSLNLVAISFLSHWLLHERMTRSRWIGVGLILTGCGFFMVSGWDAPIS